MTSSTQTANSIRNDTVDRVVRDETNSPSEKKTSRYSKKFTTMKKRRNHSSFPSRIVGNIDRAMSPSSSPKRIGRYVEISPPTIFAEMILSRGTALVRIRRSVPSATTHTTAWTENCVSIRRISPFARVPV